MEKKAVLVHPRRRRTAQPIGIQAPEKNPNVWDVVFSFAALDVPDVNGVRARFESAAKSLERLPLAQIGRVKIRWSNVIHELRPASSWKNSTARAFQPVTSRASCSSTEAVPLRRR